MLIVPRIDRAEPSPLKLIRESSSPNDVCCPESAETEIFDPTLANFRRLILLPKLTSSRTLLLPPCGTVNRILSEEANFVPFRSDSVDPSWKKDVVEVPPKNIALPRTEMDEAPVKFSAKLKAAPVRPRWRIEKPD
jgi:hypothetical protein